MMGFERVETIGDNYMYVYFWIKIHSIIFS